MGAVRDGGPLRPPDCFVWRLGVREYGDALELQRRLARARMAGAVPDLLLLVEAAGRLKQQDGSLPTTNGNVQTLCAYEDLDQGCALKDVLSPLPLDPLGSPVQNGYWYSSSGQKAKFYASLEVEIPEDQRCATEDAELKKRAYVICVETP